MLEEEFKLHPKMPNFLNKNHKQFTADQANESRICTKIRWVVEATNSTTVQNKDLPHYLIDFRIAVALINKYCDRLKSDVGNTETVVSNMLACYDLKKWLQNIVKFHGLHRKSLYTVINIEQINDFPQLDIEILKREITFGSFQLKLGPSYLNEFFKKHESFRIRTNKQLSKLDKSKILSARVQSRHSLKILQDLYKVSPTVG